MNFGLPRTVRKFFNVSETLGDRKSTRLNSSHSQISYAVFCLKKKKRKYDFKRIDYTAPKNYPSWNDLTIYLVPHPCRTQSDANWHSLHTDHSFLQYL